MFDGPPKPKSHEDNVVTGLLFAVGVTALICGTSLWFKSEEVWGPLAGIFVGAYCIRRSLPW